MMRSVYALTCCVCLALALPVHAQSGPAEPPPADFVGDQYVDSLGCVYMRAVVGGQVQWIPRLTADRVPLCEATATLEEVPAEARVAKAPEPALAARPTAPRAAKVAAPRPAAASAPRKIGCFTSAPVPLLVPLQGGGSTVVCTPGDGTMSGWRPPIYPDPAVVAAPASAAPPATITPPPVQTSVPVAEVAPSLRAKAAAPIATADPIYVQIGAFAVPENAARARARLMDLGLPAAKGKLNKDGQELMVVLAGPYADRAAATAALQAARSAGYADAFIW